MGKSNFIDDEAWAELRNSYQQALDTYQRDAEAFWENLSYDDKLYAFYSVCKRIYKGDVEKRHSYRGVLYEVFDFDVDAYAIGMDCRYMDLHNLLGDAVDKNFSGAENTSKSADEDPLS